MYRVGVVSLFAELVEPVVRFGVVGRARERGLLSLEQISPREFATDRHRTVDEADAFVERELLFEQTGARISGQVLVEPWTCVGGKSWRRQAKRQQQWSGANEVFNLKWRVHGYPCVT